jgi:hypothetical protein
MLASEGISIDDTEAIRAFADSQIRAYNSGGSPGLNDTLAVDVFRPHEFDSDSSNDESLAVLLDWLPKRSFNWRDGSKTVQHALAVFPSGGSRRVQGGREYVELDALVLIHDRRAAIEVEASINLDNGFWTLRQALRSKMADYGVMIVPWTAEGQGRADERKALGRLDREFEGSSQLSDGPIYRVAIVRRLDLCRLMLKGQPHDAHTSGDGRSR